MDIGKRLKDSIKARGFTMAQVAGKMRNERNGGIGISQPAFSDMLKGNIPFSRVAEIADIIGVSLASLVLDEHTSEVFTCPRCGAKYMIVPLETPGEQSVHS